MKGSPRNSEQIEPRGFLDYYGRHGIIPVSQSHVPLDLRRRQRFMLYRTIGLHPSCFSDATVLEIGPGTGDNAELINEMKPRSLVLLDGNPASIAALEKKFHTGVFDADRVQLVFSDFHHYISEFDRFDIVLAEGCLPFQSSPCDSLRAISRFVAEPSGIIVLTCAERLGLLPEICRRLLKPTFVSLGSGVFERSIEIASEFFADDLAALPGSTRTPRDWVTDQIFHPWPDEWELPLDVAVETLSDFDYLGSSPRFHTNWSWYKTFDDSYESSSLDAVSQWRTARLALLDHRISSGDVPELDHSITPNLRASIGELDRLVQHAWRNDSYDNVGTIQLHLLEIASLLELEPQLHRAFRGLLEFTHELPRYIEGDLSGDTPEFRHWWGRGQQYLALTRRTEDPTRE